MSMLTYAQYRERKIAELVAEYDCKASDAALCVDNRRWYEENIKPAMERGETPNEDVAKSLAKNGHMAVMQYCREFLRMTGRDDFWPTYLDLNGKVIPKGWSTVS
jgi:hypothetical protein